MGFSNQLLVLENKIIDTLTMFTWWTEVRFGKDNISWARTCLILSFLFLTVAFFLEIPQFFEKRAYVICVIFIIIGFLSLLVFLVNVTFKEFSLSALRTESPQGTPNPCRISKSHSAKRRTALFLLIASIILVKITLSIFCVYLTVAYVFQSLTQFIVACDSIPPDEKSRRKFALETEKMILTPNNS